VLTVEPGSEARWSTQRAMLLRRLDELGYRVDSDLEAVVGFGAIAAR
jgi:hypothetical protein